MEGVHLLQNPDVDSPARLFASETNTAGMDTLYFVGAALLIAATLIPLSPFQHWSVRGFDFLKVHQALAIPAWMLLGHFTAADHPVTRWIQLTLLLCFLYDGALLIQYTPLYPLRRPTLVSPHSEPISILSVNVYQFNTDYPRFLEMVREARPDMLLTMESNEDWDTAMRPLEREYPFHCKVPLENTYGIHLYSRLPMSAMVHRFVADDLPSIEADVTTKDGYRFTLFGVHPPPPSPTEEATSKERDGELMSVAKKVRQDGKTTVVVGDFNNVAWSRASRLFRRVSETIDPRVGRGLYSTFHAGSRFLRVPIDLLFHTTDVMIEELKILPDFGSDHLPLYCRFVVTQCDNGQDEQIEELEPGEMEEAEELVEEGIEEESDNREPVDKAQKSGDSTA